MQNQKWVEEGFLVEKESNVMEVGQQVLLSWTDNEEMNICMENKRGYGATRNG